MKKILFFALIILITAGCGNNGKQAKNLVAADPDSDAVRIAVQPTMESLPLMIAEDMGLFDSCGVKVRLTTFASQADCDTAVLNHSADGMITDIVRGAFWEKENKRKLNYSTWTNTHLMLISSKKSRVKELSQMTDRLMAVTRHSVSDVLADSAIERAGKSPQEMYKVQINNQEIRLNMLIENKMDAAFLQHPYAAEAVSRGGKILMHGGKSCSGVLAFDASADTLKIRTILKVYDEACDLINQKGVMYFAPVVEKYMRKDIRKWTKQLGEIKFSPSHEVDPAAKEKARKWLKDN